MKISDLLSTRVATALLALATCATAFSQDAWPQRPVRMIVPTAAGGPTDFVARLLAKHLGERLGQGVVVENLAGASGALGTAAAIKAPADGHHILFALNTPITLVPNLVKPAPYDIPKDLVAVAQVASTPLALYVNAALPAATFQEFVALAKKQKGSLSFGYPGTGSPFHLLGLLVSQQVGIELIGVPYKGAAPMLNDVIGGQVTTAINDIGVTSQFVESGKLRALATTGATRSRVAPKIPTFRELGVTGADQFSPWWGVFVPARTPPQVVARLSTEILQVLKSSEVAARLTEAGYEVAALPSDQATALVLDELVRWKKVLGELGNPEFK